MRRITSVCSGRHAGFPMMSKRCARPRGIHTGRQLVERQPPPIVMGRSIHCRASRVRRDSVLWSARSPEGVEVHHLRGSQPSSLTTRSRTSCGLRWVLASVCCTVRSTA